MIHKTAIIEKGAVLGTNVKVGPYAVIEKGVWLGDGVCVSAHANIKGSTVIKDNTFIGVGALVGEMPQMAGLHENKGKLIIGKNNIIREYVTIHTSTSPEKSTIIGDSNFLMGFSHVAHDCNIRNNVVLCNGALIAGHAEVMDNVFISGNVVVHQFVRIGRLAMVGGLSRVNQDIPPFMMVVGDSRVWGVNAVGIKRAGFKRPELSDIKKCFTIIYRKNLLLKAAIAKLECLNSDIAKEIIVFILSSRRGICGPKRSTIFEKIFLDYPYFIRNKICVPGRVQFAAKPRL
ncbi:MAG: acyl-ACP--UDP-N-acetylglucosamine O-acyltransferase [Candidatus Omnitrophota bacterium]